MDVFKKIENLSEENLHPKFKLLRDSISYNSEKMIIQEWTSDFFDKDKKIAYEFQTTFHSSFWEFYLHKVLKVMGAKLNERHHAPDFIIENAGGFYIEAVISEIKKGGDSELDRTPEDQFNNLVEFKSDAEFSLLINEAITRHSASILTKLEKYTGYYHKNKFKKGYKSHEWVEESKPYVIALSSYDQINYGKESFYSMVALLYGFYFSPETYSYNKKNSILKPNTNSEIKLGIFSDKKFSDISAIIFTSTLTLGKLTSLVLSEGQHSLNSAILVKQYDEDDIRCVVQTVCPDFPETLFDGLYVFHNPNAESKFNFQGLEDSHVMEVTSDFKSFTFEANRHLPVRARYVGGFRPFKKLISDTAFYEYNSHLIEE